VFLWRAQPHVLSTTPSPSLSGTTSCCGPGTRNATLTLGSASAKHRGVREQAGRAEPVQARAAGTPSAQPVMSKLFSLRAEGIAARLAAASRKRRASATRGTLRLRRSSHDAVTAAFHATRHSTRCAVPAPARCSFAWLRASHKSIVRRPVWTISGALGRARADSRFARDEREHRSALPLVLDPFGQSVSPALADIIGARRVRTAVMISSGSIPCR
jgi:hypothetical protein